MTPQPTVDWQVANQHYLVAGMELLRAVLRRHALGAGETTDDATEVRAAEAALRRARTAMSTPPALELIGSAFGLSPFEHMVLLLCAAMELDASFAPLCAAAHGDPSRAYPTFGLALAALERPHWSAVTPDGPLRRWRLVELGSGATLTNSALRADERIVHCLAGVASQEERLLPLLGRSVEPRALAPSHQQLANRLIAEWSQPDLGHDLPVAQLIGQDLESKLQVAASACAGLGGSLRTIRAELLATGAGELSTLIQLWSRETILSNQALLVDAHTCDRADVLHWDALTRLTEMAHGIVFVASRERYATSRRTIVVDVPKPSVGEQRAIWIDAIGPSARSLNGHVDELVSQFNLGTHAIRAACEEALGSDAASDAADSARRLWDACRIQARPRMDDLAQRIDSTATWDDLVLPDAQVHVLRELAAHVRWRAKVYDGWGFGSKGSRGLGITALFAGASGTGKTMAAEVIAHELRLDLYRIDLSSVVSKYIGETEKNLRRIFDTAEDGGAVLLFDEADALFGKRSEVKDSHDRYANIEVSYLLQRMEAYRGLAILTTNLRSALDTAFLRRIRFVLQFPFPDAGQRLEIWRRVFPTQTPTDELDFATLSRLSVAGGNIRNIALNAAFLAANTGDSVGMRHLFQAAQSEYAKLEKPLTDAESDGWPHANSEEHASVTGYVA